MRKRKHTNGCLLQLLSICAGIGFVLMAGLFGLYYISERPEVYDEQVFEQTTPVMSDGADTSKTTEITQQDLEQGAEQQTEPENKISHEAHTQVSEQAPKTEVVEERQATSSSQPEEEALTEKEIEKKVAKEAEGNGSHTPAGVAKDTSPKPTEAKEEEDFKEVSVYDAYVLSLDQEIVGQMGEIYKDGQIDYQNVIQKLFNNLSLSDQLRLLNIILSKVQNININEVWNMIKDGIDEEESVRLQEIVQANFTLEELDELYMYYQSIEMAENE